MKFKLFICLVVFFNLSAKADYVELIDDRMYFGTILEINREYVIINSGIEQKIKWSYINSIMINDDKKRGFYTPDAHGLKSVICKGKDVNWDNLFYRVKTKNGKVWMTDEIRALNDETLYIKDYTNVNSYTRKNINWKIKLKEIKKVCPPFSF